MRRPSSPITPATLAALVTALLALAGCAPVPDDPRTAEVDDGCDLDPTPATPTDPDTVSGRVRVLAAASLAEVFEEVADAFEQNQPRAGVQITAGASSDLVARLDAGAPADVLATADRATMDRAVEAGNVDTPRGFACNRMTLLVGPDDPLDIGELADLDRDDVRFVLCAPEVPCGRSGRAVLDRAGVDARPVGFEANVAAVVAKVVTGEVDAGIVYTTDAVAAAGTAEQVPIPPGVNPTTTYPAAVTTSAEEPDAAAAFVAFLRSATAREILDGYGFTTG